MIIGNLSNRALNIKELTRKVVEKEESLQHHDSDHAEHDSEDEHTPSTFIN